MNKRSWPAGLLSLLLLLPVVFGLTGCGTTSGPATPNSIAYKTIASQKAAVDAGLKAWASFQVQREAEIAALPPEDRLGPNHDLLLKVSKIVDAHDKWLLVMDTTEKSVKAALAGGSSLASPELVEATASLIALINSLSN